jgi:hypothetical protein
LRSPWKVPAVWLVLIIAVMTLAGLAYVFKLKGYFVMPDELTYQRNAIGIAENWRPTRPGDLYFLSWSQLAALVLAPVWALFDPVATALDASHAVNVVVFASACLPIYLLTHRITRSAPASLLAGAASVAVPWAAMTGTLMTEPIAYTAFCWAMLCVHRAVSEPGPRGDAIGLLGVALAVAARPHLALVAAVLVATIAIREAVAFRAEGVAVVKRHAVLLSALALGAVYAVATGTGLQDALGNYGIATEGDLVAPGTFSYGRELLTSATLACAGVTLPLAAGWALGALGSPSRRQVFAGALVVLVGGATVILVGAAFSIRFTAGQNDRYVVYLAPLLFVGTAAAFAVGPLRVVPVIAAAAVSAWLWATSTLVLQGPSLVSPASAFRTVIDGRTRLLAGDLGFASAKPTVVVAILVLAAVAAVLVSARWLRPALVGAVVGAGVLAYGIAETQYTLNKIAQTQAGASAAFVASRGWADRATPNGEPLNAFMGFLFDAPTTVATWWDGVYYNREVANVYKPSGTPSYEQPSFEVTVDERTGAIHGLPGGYLVMPAQPVQVGLQDATPVATLGPLNVVRTGARPRAAFRFDAPGGTGQLAMGASAPLRLFATGRAHLAHVRLSIVARTGPLRVTIAERDGRTLARRALVPDKPVSVEVATPVLADVPARLDVTAAPPARGAVKGALAQVLAISVGP